MSTKEKSAEHPSGVSASPTTAMLCELRELAAHSPIRARAEAWSYLRELGDRNDREALTWLFGEGTAPRGLDGKLEGLIVGKLFGVPEAKLANERIAEVKAFFK